MPIAVVALAVSMFAVGTIEFVIVGLLPTIAGDLDVSISAIGGGATSFGIGPILQQHAARAAPTAPTLSARSTSARSTSGSPSARSSAAESWPAAACTPSLGSAPSWFRSRSGWHRSTRSAPGAPVGWNVGRRQVMEPSRSVRSRLRQGLGSQRRVWFSRERAVELDARADVELGEDLVEVVFDGPWADE
jgi:hypothetical protein